NIFKRDHRLIREGFKQFDGRRGKRARFDATCTECSNDFAFLAKGDKQKGTRATDNSGLKIFSVIYVGNVKRSMLPQPARVRGVKTNLDAPRRNGAEMSPRNQIVSLAKS